jgi:23S rRNA pseudouridine1911/1915/1917 synthase
MLTEIKDYLKVTYEKPGNVYLGLVHRLDTNVGGVMVFAKTSKAASRLSDQIRKHQFKKSYLAVVTGELKPNKTYRLVDYLIKDEEKKQAIITDKTQGKESILEFEVIANKIIDQQLYSLIDIKLETGRFHQIRAQLANLGHPIYNDGKYGVNQSGHALGLYSYQIQFLHPTLKEELTFRNLPNEGIFEHFSENIRTWEENI